MKSSFKSLLARLVYSKVIGLSGEIPIRQFSSDVTSNVTEREQIHVPQKPFCIIFDTF